MKYAWLIWALIILSIWGYIRWKKPEFRKEMWKMSYLTMLFGLTEPVFVSK